MQWPGKLMSQELAGAAPRSPAWPPRLSGVSSNVVADSVISGASFASWYASEQRRCAMFEFMAGWMLLCTLLMVGYLAIWIWALVDAIRNPVLDSTTRLMWVLVIIFAQLIGAVVYLAIGRS